jgi:ATP-dependent DNA ligase
VGTTSRPPKWIKPQLTRLVDEAPTGSDWLHEIKYDGYRMHARIGGGHVKLLTRTGLDWSHRYRRTIEALSSLKVKSAYLDGELCALNGDGVPVFSRLQAAMDEGRTDQLVFFAFDLLFLNGESTAQLPLIERKERLQRLFKKEVGGLRYSEHVIGDGPRFRAQACKLGLEPLREAFARTAKAFVDLFQRSQVFHTKDKRFPAKFSPTKLLNELSRVFAGLPFAPASPS